MKGGTAASINSTAKVISAGGPRNVLCMLKQLQLLLLVCTASARSQYNESWLLLTTKEDAPPRLVAGRWTGTSQWRDCAIHATECWDEWLSADGDPTSIAWRSCSWLPPCEANKIRAIQRLQMSCAFAQEMLNEHNVGFADMSVLLQTVSGEVPHTAL
eukprot:GHUV01026565.1.p2 GENE.GHUV01026565.1~~GHUV01026565.1.p2  ORF type:complete len:158 (-),score=23.92 GHUV01026565.1:525-998(-)